MNVVNGILRDLYMVFLILALWELIFGHDLLFQPARVALVAITVVLLLAIPYRSFTNTINGEPRRRPIAPVGQGLPKMEKTTTNGTIRNLEYCRSEMQGWRPAMEDAACVDEFVNGFVPALKEWSFFGVFDGHGGAAVSRRLASELSTHFYEVCEEKHKHATSLTPENIKNAIGEAFARMDLSLRKSSPSGEFDFVGSTSIVVLVNATTMVCANVGDSRALLSRDGVCTPLSEDHKPEMPSERRRIEKAGGSVAQIGPCHRVDGWGLNLSRAFGDFHYKQRGDLEPWEQKVSAEPEIKILDLNPDLDNFFVLGCDGVFELLKNQDVIDFVSEALKSKMSLDLIVEDLLNQCISPNLLVTQGKGGDNVSAVVIKLPHKEAS